MAPGEEERRSPHPLGPRDVIEALSAWSRTILTAVVVVAVAVSAYLLGASRDRLTILDGPTAVTGVLWHCGDRLSGALAAPPGEVVIDVQDRLLVTDATDEGLVAVAVGDRDLPDHVWVESGSQRLRVPVLSCTPPTSEP